MSEIESRIMSSSPDKPEPKNEMVQSNPGATIYQITPENAPEIREPEKPAPKNLLLSPSDLPEKKQHELFMAIKYGFEDLDLSRRFRWDELRVGVPDENSSNYKVYEDILNIVAVQFGVIFEGYNDVERFLIGKNFQNGSRTQDGLINPVYTKQTQRK